MSVLIADSDEQSRAALTGFAQKAGYFDIVECRSLRDVISNIQKKDLNLRLVVASWEVGGGSDFPLSRFLIGDSRFHSTPLILMFNHASLFHSSTEQDMFSRVDAHLIKPFGFSTFNHALEVSHERRAQFRKTLVLFGDRFKTSISEAILNTRAGFHWGQVEVAQNFLEFQRVLLEKQFLIGAIVVDPTSFTDSDWNEFHLFRKTKLGASIAVVGLGNSPKLSYPIRTQAEWFIDPPSTQEISAWESLLVKLSQRVLFRHRFQKKYLFALQAIKDLKLKLAIRTLNEMIKVDSSRWEIDEIRARIFQAKGQTLHSIESFKHALLGNPCSVKSHLGILVQSKGAEKQRALEIALQFCPDQPDVRKLGLG